MRNVVIAISSSHGNQKNHLADSIIRCLSLSVRYRIQTVDFIKINTKGGRGENAKGKTEECENEMHFNRLRCLNEQHKLELLIPTTVAELGFYTNAQEQLSNEGIQVFMPDSIQFALQDPKHIEYIAWLIGFRVYSEKTEGQADLIHIAGVGDGAGDCTGLRSISRIEQTEQGQIVAGIIVDHPRLAATAQSFVRVSRWKGAFELECVLVGDVFYLKRLNANLPSWVHLTATEEVSMLDEFLECALNIEPNTSCRLKMPKGVCPNRFRALPLSILQSAPRP